MCSVIGAIIKEPRTEDFLMLHRVFLESKIRGMHATGISYVKHGKIITEKRPVPADEFPFNFPSYVNEDGSLYMIGHCRYSTSDLEFNQPIANENLSVVHNGVITQELPEKWKELYGYDCETKNDTELILHTAEDCISPLIRWKDSSLAVIELHVDKVIRFYRNGKRPLYLTSISNGCIITSTADVPKRAEVPGFPINTLMNHYITFDDQLAMTIEREVIEDEVDLQYELC
ncbi:Gn_AT_II domain containing protein [uncultured Caudovirales phage]|uniref:Gn_AT_II domain containing protein n=1 Tax=uncultured Caudovirales phage TaxID=2100421 RepID=A0A6J5RQ67_9CAUD|nr:Gn_AT_II domain containing protein [uncultured Caudovirales phage]CAB4181805.1 Gn_AT_II domain containing protein [uncultured Caudovirales phage]CAB4198172.1 Gn_AT_II domain containing protein [uncultured Caudovirales phage]CAB4211328.1 Gn_AT_II domain containing protein [uncultured Caudovirales phage]CAB5238286.1 Gn_AT_II domain containing protein [uncultured Caudovirales phage]